MHQLVFVMVLVAQKILTDERPVAFIEILLLLAAVVRNQLVEDWSVLVEVFEVSLHTTLVLENEPMQFFKMVFVSYGFWLWERPFLVVLVFKQPGWLTIQHNRRSLVLRETNVV